jgi:hypothetical protein
MIAMGMGDSVTLSLAPASASADIARIVGQDRHGDLAAPTM